uniref:Uncharacterized protein n=1 Tax=Coccidioides posadasii RMSCC 3488 TaxID=454284 RepID=A0A0J6F4K1_COCPO|nr:hypothetical protein CPAG_00542 [Coccidioides posadasii RMSCC 3488]
MYLAPTFFENLHASTAWFISQQAGRLKLSSSRIQHGSWVLSAISGVWLASHDPVLSSLHPGSLESKTDWTVSIYIQGNMYCVQHFAWSKPRMNFLQLLHTASSFMHYICSAGMLHLVLTRMGNGNWYAAAAWAFSCRKLTHIAKNKLRLLAEDD